MGEEQHHVTPIQRSETDGLDLTNTPELSRRKRQFIIGPLLAGAIYNSVSTAASAAASGAATLVGGSASGGGIALVASKAMTDLTAGVAVASLAG